MEEFQDESRNLQKRMRVEKRIETEKIKGAERRPYESTAAGGTSEGSQRENQKRIRVNPTGQRAQPDTPPLLTPWRGL